LRERRPFARSSRIRSILSNLFANGVRRNPEDLFTRSDLLSRWQMQWGLRFRF
jgi:hypothetical protein